MTPKEKARELVEKYMTYIPMQEYEAKQCAFIAVDDNIEELEHIKQYIDELDVNIINFQIHYLEQVKTEIENL